MLGPTTAPTTTESETVQELLAEVRRLRDFAGLSADWFWEQDAQFRFVSFTGKAIKQLAHTPDDYIGLRRWELPISGISDAQLQAHIAVCERHEPFRDFEYEFPGTDGALQRFSISGTPMYDPEGGFIGYRGLGRNITSLYRAQQALHEREVLLAQIVSGSPVPSFVINASHQVTHWNRACESLTGISAGDMLGRADTWRAFYGSPRPTLSDLVLDGADAALLASYYGAAYCASPLIAGAVEAEAYFEHFPGAGNDGRWVFFTAAPLLDGQGNTIGALETLQDISEKRRNAQSMATLVRDYSLIFDNALIGISHQKNRRIERCNRRMEEMFGWPPGGLIGQSTRVLFATAEEWLAAGQCLDSNAKTFDGEMAHVRKDGTPLVMHMVGRTIDDGTTWIWTHEDVTEASRARSLSERLFREQKMIFERAGTGILFTRDRVIQRCNPAFEAIFGRDSNTMLGQPTRILFASDQAWHDNGVITYAALSSQGRFDGEMGYCNLAGESICCKVTGSWVNPDDLEEGAVWLFEDVTQSRRSAAAMQSLLHDYTLIFENALVGMAFMKDRLFLRCNRRLEEMFGYAPGAMVGMASRALFASEDAWLAAGQRYQQAAQGDQSFSDEIRYLRHDGTPIWVRVSGQHLVREDGQYWIWSFQEVTRRRLAEEELRQSHAALEQRVMERTNDLSRQVHFMQQLIEAIPGPVFYKDRAGAFLGCNQAFTQFLGRTRAELIGRSAHDFSPKHLADVYAEADEWLYHSMQPLIYETRVQSADGQEREVMFHKAVFRDTDGQVGGLIGVMLDISERLAMEARLRQSATVFDSTADGVVIADSQSNIVAVNRAFTEITGYSESDVLGRNPRMLQSGRQDPAFYRSLWKALARDGRWRGEVWNRRKNGEEYAEWLTVNAVTDKNAKVTHFVAVFSDVTPIKRAQERLDYQAHHDVLTGLPNRLLFEDRIEKALALARRDGSGLAVLFVDLDRFKNINDTLGHQVGDLVLVEVAKRFRAVLRDSDTVARLGGDEFVVVLQELTEPAAASRVADKIIESLQHSMLGAGQEFFIGASIGISLFPQDGNDAATLLKNADVAMYRAKDRGRNTYEFFVADLTAVSLERFQLEVDIRHAVERNELLPFFQAQYCLRSGRMVGAETLIRWSHPVHGMVPPGTFIPLAEESGLIVAVGAWMLRQSTRLWAQWIARGFAPGILSVNVSGVEFRRGHVFQSVQAALAQSGLAPQYLSLEITESAIMNQAESSIRELHALRDLGVQLAIDDFGTGYSSLAYLKRLPLNKLKIDQGFVQGLPDNEEDAAITRAVIALAHSLQFTTIAEGVETHRQESFLRAAGCDEMQGYLRARPLSAAAFESSILSKQASLPNVLPIA